MKIINILKSWFGIESRLLEFKHINVTKNNMEETIKKSLECYQIHEELKCDKYCDKYAAIKNKNMYMEQGI